MKITIGVPTNRLIKSKTAKCLMDLVNQSNHDLEIVISTRGYNTSENRNYIAAKSVKNGSDYLFFIDDDMIFPPDILDDLLEHDKDIVGGVYKTKYEIQDDVVTYFKKSDKKQGLFKVKAIGTGMLLIKTSVFRKLKQPWFKYSWYKNGMVKRSHDWIFCYDARKAKIDIWADNTLDIKHIGLKTY